MKHIYATFNDSAMAEKAAGALLDHGIKAEYLSIVFPETYKSKYSGKVLGEELKEDHAAKTGISTTTSQDANVGAAKGAGIGLVAGTLAALAAIFIPGVGLVLGGGALALAVGGMAGTTVAGAVAGGVTGALVDQGVPAIEVEHYERIIKNGGALLTISAPDEHVDWTEITDILTKYEGALRPIPLSPIATGPKLL